MIVQISVTAHAATVETKLKPMFMPLGRRVRHANIRRPSVQRLFMVLQYPVRLNHGHQRNGMLIEHISMFDTTYNVALKSLH